jgi:hypothetical protein
MIKAMQHFDRNGLSLKTGLIFRQPIGDGKPTNADDEHDLYGAGQRFTARSASAFDLASTWLNLKFGI